MCCVAFWRAVVFEIPSAQKATYQPPLPKRACLQGRNDEQVNEASFGCTCNPVASLPNKRSESAGDREVTPSKKKALTSGCVRQETDMYRQLGRCSDRSTW